MYTKMPRYIIYFIQYKYSDTDIIILDMWNKRRILNRFLFNNNRPKKKFTPKLLKKLETDAYIFTLSIEDFTKVLQDRFCWNTMVNMKELIDLIKAWEIMKSTGSGEIEKITKLQIIP